MDGNLASRCISPNDEDQHLLSSRSDGKLSLYVGSCLRLPRSGEAYAEIKPILFQLFITISTLFMVSPSMYIFLCFCNANFKFLT